MEVINLKLNNECVRDILLEIESRQNVLFENFSYDQLQKFDSFSKYGHDHFFIVYTVFVKQIILILTIE